MKDRMAATLGRTRQRRLFSLAMLIRAAENRSMNQLPPGSATDEDIACLREELKELVLATRRRQQRALWSYGVAASNHAAGQRRILR
jgi:hypothetical protein